MSSTGRRASALSHRLTAARVTLYGLGFPLLLGLLAASSFFESLYRYVLVVVGFSVIIFFHELGHFIVARLCSVKCEVFSIGIGPRMLGWKKGLGLSFGKEPDDPKTGKPEEQTLEGSARGAASLGDLEQTAQPVRRNSSLGQTDYRVSWLPLGGYVRMLGQDDLDPTKVSTDPHAFNNRPIWQRMCIVSAGVAMNVLFAFVIFSIIFNHSVGVMFPPAVVGRIYAGSSADTTRNSEGLALQPGDRIVAIDGQRPGEGFLEFTDVMISSALATRGEKVSYTFVRGSDPAEHTIDLTPRREKGAKLMAVGIEPMFSLKLPQFDNDEKKAYLEVHPELAEALAVLQPGDTVVAVDGDPVSGVAGAVELNRRIQASQGRTLRLTVHNADSNIADRVVPIQPQLARRPGINFNESPPILGLYPRARLGAPTPKSAAAKAGLKNGDILLRIGAIENPSIPQVYEQIQNNGGRTLTLQVLRGTQTVTCTPTLGNKDGRGFLGVALDMDVAHPVVAAVEPDSAAAKGGAAPGSAITSIDGQPVTDWNQVLTAARQAAGKSLEVVVTDTAGHTTTLAVPTPKDDPQLARLHYELGLTFETYNELQRADSFVGSLAMGLDHTKKFIIQTYLTLRGLSMGTVPLDELHGALGIAKLGHDIQERGFVHLLYILGVVSVNLAVANFLPLPVVDGGLFLLLILEKIRGRPLPLKVLSAINIAGICLLAGLFVFVTYNDVFMFMK